MKVDLYAIPPDESSRYFPGDIELRRWIRSVLEPIRDRPPNGLTKVALNLAASLQAEGCNAMVHTRFRKPRHGAYVGIVNAPPRLGRLIAEKADCLVGPGVLNVPDDWPDMFDSKYNVKAYLQACEWQADVFRTLYPADKVRIWPVGIDSDYYKPLSTDEKIYDLMIYDKRRWPDKPPGAGLLEQCISAVHDSNMSYQVITYGKYGRGGEKNFERLARNSRAMLFLCENETQGIAYNQVLSMGLPIIAWDQLSWQDPCRFKWGLDYVPATSIPYWDQTCGESFTNAADLRSKLPAFMKNVRTNTYFPREFILKVLSPKQRTKEYLDLLISLCEPFTD